MIRSKISKINRICRYAVAGAAIMAALMMGSNVQVMAETEATATETTQAETAATETTETTEDTTETKIIDSVVVTGATRPYGGMAVNRNLKVSGEGYEIYHIGYKDTADDTWLGLDIYGNVIKGTTYQAGHTYKLMVYLQAKDGYQFKVNTDEDTGKQTCDVDGMINEFSTKCVGITYVDPAERICLIFNYAVTQPQSISKYASATTLSSSVTYTGKATSANVAVKGLKAGTDYTVSYANNTAVGTATVKITGKGNYTGSYTRTYNILPKKPVIKKIAARKKKIVLRMSTKPTATGGSYYEIQYHKAGSKVWKSKKTTLLRKTINPLTSKKKYRIRVRACKTVNGKVYCSAWTAVKTSGKVK